MPEFPYHVEPYPSTSGPEVWGNKEPIDLPKRYKNCGQLSRSSVEIEYQCDNSILMLVKIVDVFTGVPIQGNPAMCQILHSVNVYKIAVGSCDRGVNYPLRPVGEERAVWLAKFEDLEHEIARKKEKVPAGR